jgi:formamidopyrimidine-DNA glycosylase
MPELPDIENYIDASRHRISGQLLQDVRLQSAFLLRTADPPIEVLVGKRVQSIRRIGKRIALGLREDYWIVLHLMIAGRLHWRGRIGSGFHTLIIDLDGLPTERRCQITES